MRKSSKNGLFGVRYDSKRDHYVAFRSRRGLCKTIGAFDTQDAAAKAYDAYMVGHHIDGVMGAWSGLNFPESYRSEFEAAKARKLRLAEEAQENLEAELLATPIPIAANPEIIRRHLTQNETPDEIARALGFHPTNVSARIGALLNAKQEVRLDCSGLRDHVRKSLALGESVRAMAERLGLPRSLLTKWLA